MKQIPNNLQNNFSSLSNIDCNPSNLNNNIENNTSNSYINNTPTEFMSKKYVNEIKEIYEKEKNDLKKKIIELTKDLNSTKKNLEERIDYLHQHLNEVNLKNKNDFGENKC